MTYAESLVAAEALLERLERVKADTPALWGRMNAGQMMAHCQALPDLYFGTFRMRRALVGYLFGKMAKRKLFSPKPWPRGLPTAKQFVYADERDFEKEKEKLVGLMRRFMSETPAVYPAHPFFGPMTAEEWRVIMCRHLDHHLQQFSV